jgi:UDP-N-acetylmuramoyl-L-alanyl-D-glutamate--2,6-diaminopimelate ligase
VTGTNGKTSVAHFVESIARAGGMKTGVIGTLGVRIGDVPIRSERTTPEASDLQRILARMVDESVGVAAMEVSSHALELGRVEGARFAVAAFTNLSQDHLDFHGDMESYFAAKTKLFDPDKTDEAVVCVDDSWGIRLAGMSAARGIPTRTVGFEHPASITVAIDEASISGSTIGLAIEGERRFTTRVPIPGRFSVSNAAVAAACCLDMMGEAAVAEGIGATRAIPGRFEVVASTPVAVVVDYSHTPAGIAAAIDTARPLAQGRIIAVFGAGGDRDKGKRPLMGQAASQADILVVTSDNPRSEDPAAIIKDIVPGVTSIYETIIDRHEAIERAIAMAVPGDLVLIMGKGHETYQEIAGVRQPFDDREVAREVLGEIVR